MKWYIKQLLPMTYWTRYKEGGETRFVIWKMWLGRSYDIVDYAIKGD